MRCRCPERATNARWNARCAASWATVSPAAVAHSIASTAAALASSPGAAAVGGGRPDGELLEGVEEGEELVDVAGRQPCDAHAAPGQVLHQPLLAEQAQ